MVGWRTYGSDIDLAAVTTTRRNAPRSTVERSDARQLPFPDAATAAVVSNLPFGRQYAVDDHLTGCDVLTEQSRVVRPGGRVVVPAVTIPRAATPRQLTLIRRIPLRLLGKKAAIYERG